MNDVLQINQADDSKETQDNLKQIVKSLAEVTKFRDFQTEDIAQNVADSLEYIQRLDGAIADMNNDPDFVNNFVEALGNIIKFSSRRAEYIYANRQENTIADTSAYAFVDVEEPETGSEAGTPADAIGDTIGDAIGDAISDNIS